jgi:hypothetical protein
MNDKQTTDITPHEMATAPLIPGDRTDAKIIQAALLSLKTFGSGKLNWFSISTPDSNASDGYNHYTIVQDAEKPQMGMLVISSNVNVPSRTFTVDQVLNALGYY